MRAPSRVPPPSASARLVAAVDADGDGQISYTEFLAMIATQISNTEAEVTKEVFKVRP